MYYGYNEHMKIKYRSCEYYKCGHTYIRESVYVCSHI